MFTSLLAGAAARAHSGVLQDAISINLAGDNGDFQEFDPTLLERIEAHRGGLHTGGRP